MKIGEAEAEIRAGGRVVLVEEVVDDRDEVCMPVTNKVSVWMDYVGNQNSHPD